MKIYENTTHRLRCYVDEDDGIVTLEDSSGFTLSEEHLADVTAGGGDIGVCVALTRKFRTTAKEWRLVSEE